MKTFKDYLAEEEYDRQRDADAVSGKPRKSYSKGIEAMKKAGNDKANAEAKERKDKAEKASMDNVKKALAKESVEEACGKKHKQKKTYEDQDNKGFTDKQIKMAYGVLNDPRYKGGNMTGAVSTIEKIAKGLSKHPGVQKALQRTNESSELARIRDLSGITEETYDGDDFYEAYGDLWYNEDEVVDEAEYQGRKVPLGKPMRGDVKKFKVYVKNPKGNVVKVNFGDPDMKIKKSNPARRRSFRARHNCDNPGPRTKARYWSCRKW